MADAESRDECLEGEMLGRSRIRSWAWRHTPVISAIWSSEAEGL